jgi:hypothetical protein
MRPDLWTPDEDAKLRSSEPSGLSLAEISQQIGRQKLVCAIAQQGCKSGTLEDQTGMQKKARAKR